MGSEVGADPIPHGTELFRKLSPAVAALPQRAPLLRQDLLVPVFRLYQDPPLEIYYCPFDYTNVDAKVIFLGLTPGWTQMELAFRTARDGLIHGCDEASILSSVHQHASFSGSMRANLVGMLDDLGLNQLLGIKTTASLFGPSGHLVHTSSAVRYPVFISGQNYTGASPGLRSTPVLLRFVQEVLAEECSQVGCALIIPLGKAASEACQILISNGRLELDRCLLGFPHPSGANGHRASQFALTRDRMAEQLNSWFSR